MKILCRIFGHKLIEDGFVFMEWTSKGKALMNKLKHPIKMQKLKCKRCDAQFVSDNSESL
jgi:hypothetical protein